MGYVKKSCFLFSDYKLESALQSPWNLNTILLGVR